MSQRSNCKLLSTIIKVATRGSTSQLPLASNSHILDAFHQIRCLSLLLNPLHVNVARNSKFQQPSQSAGCQDVPTLLQLSATSFTQQQTGRQPHQQLSQVSRPWQYTEAVLLHERQRHVPVLLPCQQQQSSWDKIRSVNHLRLSEHQQRCYFHQQQGIHPFLQHGPCSPLPTAHLSRSIQNVARQIATQQQQQQKPSGSSLLSVPNMLSLSRVAAGPWVSYLIATQQWPLAVGLTAAAGVTDWLDGYLARKLGHTSKLGSYLDPFADKVLIGCVVSTMGYLQMLPAWLAVMVVGRDAAQISGMVWYRWHMLGRRWPGAAAFLDVDGSEAYPAATGAVATGSSKQQADSSSSTDIGREAAVQPAGLNDLPQIKPLLVSKLNTALVFVLIAGSAAQQWQGVPGYGVLEWLEYAVAGTTAVSATWYVRLYLSGKLLPPVPRKQ